MEPQGLLPCSQQSAAGPCSQPDQSSPHPRPFISLTHVLLLSYSVCLVKLCGLLPSGFPPKYVHLSSHPCFYLPIPSHHIPFWFCTDFSTVSGEWYKLWQSLGPVYSYFLRPSIASFLLGPNVGLPITTLTVCSSGKARHRSSCP